MMIYFSSILKGVFGEKLQFIILKHNILPLLNPLYSLVGCAIISHSEGLEGGRSYDTWSPIIEAFHSVDLSGEQVIVFVIHIDLVPGDDIIEEGLSQHWLFDVDNEPLDDGKVREKGKVVTPWQ
jgi:hypothetical protein